MHFELHNHALCRDMHKIFEENGICHILIRSEVSVKSPLITAEGPAAKVCYFLDFKRDKSATSP